MRRFVVGLVVLLGVVCSAGVVVWAAGSFGAPPSFIKDTESQQLLAVGATLLAVGIALRRLLRD
jgi:hypothetical protein